MTSSTGEIPFPHSRFTGWVMSRDGSSRRSSRFIAAQIRAPGSVPCSGSSLPVDQNTTLGWFRSRRIIRSNWLRPSGEDENMRVSSRTTMPSRSQASSNSGVGALCEVRYPFEPISLSFSMRKYCSRSGKALPTPAWS